MAKMKNEDTNRTGALRFKVPWSILSKLTIERFPKVDEKGTVTGTVPNPNVDSKGRFEPYEFLDDTQGAPTGFGIFVGSRGASYRVRRRFEERFVKFLVGMVSDMNLTEAHEKARTMWADVVASEGRNPKKVQKEKRALTAMKHATVRDGLKSYIDHLKGRSEKAKETSVNSVEDSLARLARPEVGLADREIRTLSRQVLQTAWKAVRTEAMRRSSYVPAEVKAKLLDPQAIRLYVGEEKPWFELTEEELEKMGVKGKVNAKVRAAGLSATEHTFADASRGVKLLLKEELRAADREDRKAELRVNPFEELEDNFRSLRQLNTHYKEAEVRNPLTKEDSRLANVLKSIVARRLEKSGLNKTASDYLLLTLLWGARRNETAQLEWYDNIDPKKVRKVSWVWLAENEKDHHPFTKKTGSQVYFHDTKNGESHLLPICYIAKRILLDRLHEREEMLSKVDAEIADARQDLVLMEKKPIEDQKPYISALTRLLTKRDNQGYVFPARSTKAKKGYYSDSKSILKNIRTDAGFLDMAREIDVGLTPHDFRRTLGSFAGNELRGPVVTRLLNHKIREEDVSPVDGIYTETEWMTLREGLGKVEEVMLKTSPRVWNVLRGADKPMLDEVNDPPIELFHYNTASDVLEGNVGLKTKGAPANPTGDGAGAEATREAKTVMGDGDNDA